MEVALRTKEQEGWNPDQFARGTLSSQDHLSLLQAQKIGRKLPFRPFVEGEHRFVGLKIALSIYSNDLRFHIGYHVYGDDFLRHLKTSFR